MRVSIRKLRRLIKEALESNVMLDFLRHASHITNLTEQDLGNFRFRLFFGRQPFGGPEGGMMWLQYRDPKTHSSSNALWADQDVKHHGFTMEDLALYLDQHGAESKTGNWNPRYRDD